MLDGLSFMAGRYDRIVVLEDDCFPTQRAIEVFDRTLSDVENDPSVYSVYGHHFGVPGEGDVFTRFQGWGWASTRKRLSIMLPALRETFMMSEADYLLWVASALTPRVRAALDVTPGRDVTQTLERVFSWDSTTALLSATAGLTHRKTSERVVYNDGIGSESGHFHVDSMRLRAPPFNMIGVDEVWQYFSATLPAEYRDRQFFGLDELDRHIAAFLTQEKGVFVEVGAYDGLNQSNTLYFERKGWRGLLIEPVAAAYEQCRKNRPLAKVINAACVSRDFPRSEVELTEVGLMTMVRGARGGSQDEELWARRGEDVQRIKRSSCRAPAKTLTAILDAENVTTMDLLSIDVEGYESSVLDGLDFSRYRPRHVVIEDSGTADIESMMRQVGYALRAVLSTRSYTRDLLFRDITAAPETAVIAPPATPARRTDRTTPVSRGRARLGSLAHLARTVFSRLRRRLGW
jgi:FkbM family methyltransferase